jgi:ABC-type nickel/cobalt efflux system permease component RcnA
VLGLAWGLGHATTLFAVGLPIVLFNSHLPGSLQRAAEVTIGLVIVVLAIRLLVRWRRGRFHAHSHRHGAVEHRHLHPHEHGHPHAHSHEPEALLGRSPLQSFGIGLAHGVDGSAGVGVLLFAAMPDHTARVVALIVFATGTAASMALLSGGLGYALTRGPVVRRFAALAPALGVLSLLFGAWYTLGALNALPGPV